MFIYPNQSALESNLPIMLANELVEYINTQNLKVLLNPLEIVLSKVEFSLLKIINDRFLISNLDSLLSIIKKESGELFLLIVDDSIGILVNKNELVKFFENHLKNQNYGLDLVDFAIFNLENNHYISLVQGSYIRVNF